MEMEKIVAQMYDFLRAGDAKVPPGTGGLYSGGTSSFKGNLFVDDLTASSTATHSSETIRRLSGLTLADRGIEISTANIVDAMELTCEVFERVRNDRPCTSQNAPEVRTAGDLDAAAQHVACMARELEGSLGQRVFSHVPSKAVDALRRESSLGSFPQVGGDLGEAVSRLRGALVELADVAPQITGEMDKMAQDVRRVRIAIDRHEVAKRMADVEFQSMSMDRMTSCAVAAADTVGVGTLTSPGKLVAAAATCANSVLQVELGEKLRNLKDQDVELATEDAIAGFDGAFSDRAGLLERLGTRANAAVEEIDAQLSQIENLRLKARRSLNRALYVNSFQAEKQMAINSGMRQRFNTAGIRYEKAFKSARRVAFIAKRAVEQRLGVRLSSMQEKLPLVDAPSSWENDLCSNQGIDWTRISDENADVKANYADRFIGDYVRNLENVVESYRLVNNFHEGLDTAVVSLKEDVYRTVGTCPVPSKNHLSDAGQLDEWKKVPVPNSWNLTGCETDVDGTPLPDCLDIETIADLPTTEVAFGTPKALGYRVTFGPTPVGLTQAPCDGCGLGYDTEISQKVTLSPGPYLLSWYSRRVEDAAGASTFPDAHGTWAVAPYLEDGSYPADAHVSYTNVPNRWRRNSFTFSVPSEQTVTIAIEGFDVSEGPYQVELGGLMLEATSAVVPSTLENTGNTLTRLERGCADTNGNEFRKSFVRGCSKLCSNGFDGQCSGDDIKEHCYRGVQLPISQRDIESGRLLPRAGFALGNFNYRIESIAVNFVGTGLRSCAAGSSSCYARGDIPYSLIHGGPYFVRNHLGQDFEASLFTAHIEHARGLASERYITNPTSSADLSLLTPYTRQEFQGRPLDGNFTLRVWDDEGVDFDQIEDVQVVLNYRYWTRFD
jgi:hypothetical protein